MGRHSIVQIQYSKHTQGHHPTGIYIIAQCGTASWSLSYRKSFRKYIRGASGRERMLLSNWKSRKMTFTTDVSIKRGELHTLQPPLTRKNESLPTTLTITTFCLRLFQPSGMVSRNQHDEGMNPLQQPSSQHVYIMDSDTRLTPMRNFTTSTMTVCFDTMLATLICASKKFH